MLGVKNHGVQSPKNQHTPLQIFVVGCVDISTHPINRFFVARISMDQDFGNLGFWLPVAQTAAEQECPPRAEALPTPKLMTGIKIRIDCVSNNRIDKDVNGW